MPTTVVQRKKQLTSALLESDSKKKISQFNSILAEAAQSENLPFLLPIRIACALDESIVASQYLAMMSDNDKLDVIESCLIVAVYFKKETVVKFLQGECKRLTENVFELKDPLVWASKIGDVELITVITSNPLSDLNICDPKLGSPLQIAIFLGQVVIINHLLKFSDRLNVNLVTKNCTPLMSTILSINLSETQKLEYVKKLIELGADATISVKVFLQETNSWEEATALSLAQSSGLSTIVEYLNSHQAQVNKATFSKVLSKPVQHDLNNNAVTSQWAPSPLRM